MKGIHIMLFVALIILCMSSTSRGHDVITLRGVTFPSRLYNEACDPLKHWSPRLSQFVGRSDPCDARDHRPLVDSAKRCAIYMGAQRTFFERLFVHKIEGMGVGYYMFMTAYYNEWADQNMTWSSPCTSWASDAHLDTFKELLTIELETTGRFTFDVVPAPAEPHEEAVVKDALDAETREEINDALDAEAREEINDGLDAETTAHIDATADIPRIEGLHFETSGPYNFKTAWPPAGRRLAWITEDKKGSFTMPSTAIKVSFHADKDTPYMSIGDASKDGTMEIYV